MKLITRIIRIWTQHGTKLLGTAQTIVSGVVLIDGFNTKGWLVANVVLGALTIKRGYVNSKSQDG